MGQAINMIIDTITNAARYYPIKGIKESFEFLSGIDKDMASGRYEITDGIYASVDTYTTKDIRETKFESHRRYTDIQLLLSGREQIAWTTISSLSPATGYDMEKDIIFYNTTTDSFPVFLLSTNMFMLFFPEDAHMPQIAPAAPAQVKKVVIKIPSE